MFLPSKEFGSDEETGRLCVSAWSPQREAHKIRRGWPAQGEASPPTWLPGPRSAGAWPLTNKASMLLKNKEMEEANCTFAIPKPGGRRKLAIARGVAQSFLLLETSRNLPRRRADYSRVFKR